MPSLIAEEMRRAYLAQRGVSQGAGITLVSKGGHFEARFDCARKCSLVLGDRNLIVEGATALYYIIDNEEMARALSKLAESFSIALVDTVTDESGTRFVLIWKISASATKDVEELAPDPNQGNLPLGGILPISSDPDDY